MNDPALALDWELRLRSDVDRTISDALGYVGTRTLREILQNSTSGGKRIRPLLTVLACAAAGGLEDDALPAAASLELLHASSLVHDDIMDDADLRRGMTAVHKQHGVPMAILAGDALIALAYRVLITTKSKASAEILSIFSSCFLDLCEGQCADISFPASTMGESSEHVWMVERKTARLAEACMKIGALVGTTDRSIVDSLGTYGLHLGFAYQAMDDLLDAVGDEAVTGKSTGRDAHNGRETYLTLAYPTLDRFHATRSVIALHTHQALAALDKLSPSEARERLADLARTLRDRVS
jgi:geranylgeranyl pyrophosphate synthase